MRHLINVSTPAMLEDYMKEEGRGVQGDGSWAGRVMANIIRYSCSHSQYPIHRLIDKHPVFKNFALSEPISFKVVGFLL